MQREDKLLKPEEKQLAQIVESIEDLTRDDTIPRNVKSKLTEILVALRGPQELSIKVDKALNDLDEICSDTNLQSYTRTQVMNISCLLESILL